MDLRAALGFPFRGPHAWATIGSLFVCFLIPIIGPIVITGYLIVVEKSLIENIQVDAVPFVFGRFSRYLQRGLMPFLGSLVLSFMLVPLIIVFLASGVAAFIFLQDKPAWLAAAIGVLVLFYFASFIVFNVVVAPLYYKASVEESFQAIFDAAYLLDYLKRVGWLALRVQLLLMMIFIFPVMVLACIPILGALVLYGVMAAIMLITAHVNTQLYLIYLERGGRALLIKPEPLENGAFPVLVREPGEPSGWSGPRPNQ